LFASVVLLACGDTHRAAVGDAGGAESDQPEPVLLTSIEPEPAGASCAYGGQRVRAGLDQDDDGTLQPDEVRASTVVCQSAAAVVDAGSATLDAALTDDAAADDDGALNAPDCVATPVGHHTVATDSTLDFAIAGAGFFVLRAPTFQSRVNAYTRVGRFHIDREGYLVDRQSYRVEGYGLDSAGVLSDRVDDLRVSIAALPARATTRAALSVNLDSTVVRAPAWDPASPATTSTFSSSLTVFDARGAGHQVTVFFVHVGETVWRWFAAADGGDFAGQKPGVPHLGASGELAFSPDGALASESLASSSWSFLGAEPQTILFDFGSSLADHGSGVDGTTSFASPSTTNLVDQDGYPAGSPSSIETDASGVLTIVYSNLHKQLAGQLVLASFLSADGLACAGDDHWLASEQSGEPLLGTAGSVGHGVIRSSVLEQR
jgi:flagellar hook protein FlgE